MPNVLLVFVLLTLVSCAVGPNYQAPQLNLPDQFSEQEREENKTSSSDWWKSFDDEVLTNLIEKAVGNNKSIKQALARVNQSRALARESKSELFPGAQVGASYEKSKNPGSRFPGEEGQENRGFNYEVYTSSLDASWEIDLFGGLRRGLEASNADYAARVAELEDALRLLTSDIAMNYFALRGSQLQQRVALKNAALQKETLDIVSAKHKFGQVSELDVLRAKTQLEQTNAETPLIKANVKSQIYRLSVLLGEEPASLTELLKEAKDIPTFKGEMSIDKPSDLLRRRPDLRVAERKLAAETARIGVAVSDLYPKITIDGSLGLEAPKVSNLSDSSSETYIFGPRVIWRPFDSGKLRARIREREARTEEALYAYEEVVLEAIEDVENSLLNFKAQRERRLGLKKALDAAKKAHKLAKAQYEEGVLDFISVLDTQKSVLENENNFALSERDFATAIVGIYKALGGGWEKWELGEAKS